MHTTDLQLEYEKSCVALKNRIVCETLNKVDKSVRELDKLEYECDTLNKEVGFSYHSYCHCLIGLVVTW
jgi:hypothetical protein